MLFSRIFNWIKYKTLPPSLLFRNRLYVERDSKHRRVASNLGLTFRNSKWSSYSRVNVNLTSKTNYLRLLWLTLLAFIAVTYLFSYTRYYDQELLLNSIFAPLWFVLDSDIYLKALLVSSWICCLQISTTIYQEQLIKSLTGDNYERSTDGVRFSSLPKFLHKPVLYSYLSKKSDTALLSKLLNPNSLQTNKPQSVLLTHDLFLVSNLLLKANVNVVNLGTVVRGNNSSVHRLSSIPKPSAAALDYVLFNEKNIRDGRIHRELAHWTLNAIGSESALNNLELNFRTGLFYAPSLSYANLERLTSLNPELAGLATSLGLQLSSVRQQRWLYKYNLLHRSILKNAHKITLAKKLIGSGFLNDSLLERSVWTASNLTAYTRETGGIGRIQTSNFSNPFIKGVYGSIYGQYLDPSEINNSTHLPLPIYHSLPRLGTLAHYEESYYWFLKRYYSFNALSSSSFEFSIKKGFGNERTTIKDANTLVCSTSLFDVLASSPNNTSLNTPSVRGTSDSSDYFLHYADYSYINKSRAEQMMNLSKNYSHRVNKHYTPKPLSSNLTSRA